MGRGLAKLCHYSLTACITAADAPVIFAKWPLLGQVKTHLCIEGKWSMAMSLVEFQRVG